MLGSEGHAQEQVLLPRPAHRLHPRRQPARVIAHREGDGRQPGQIAWHGKAHQLRYRAQVRPAVGFAAIGYGWGSHGRRRGQNDVHLAERASKMIDSPRANALRLQIVGRGHCLAQRQIHPRRRA